MYAVVCDYLLIPGAEVNVERLFNIVREILGFWRILINIETL
jgi:hypothetical protein